MASKKRIKWAIEPDAHDYPAAESYLSLIYDKETAAKLVDRLRAAEKADFAAKDIFRASRLALLDASNSHVKNDRARIMSGKKVSPVLLVRDATHGQVIIADGYHRLCAVYTFDEDARIPCKII